MISAIEHANTKFFLPIGDDEVLVPGALSQIIGQLKIDDPDLLVLNGWHTKEDLSPIREHLPQTLQATRIDSPSKAFLNLWDKTPPGSVIMKRSLLHEANMETYVGTSHAYSGAIWAGLSDTFKQNGYVHVRCMADKTVFLRNGQKSWKKESARIKYREIPLWLSLINKDECYNEAASHVLQSYLETTTRYSTLIAERLFGGMDAKLSEHAEQYYLPHQMDKIRRVLSAPRALLWMLYPCFRGVLAIRNLARGKTDSFLS